MFIVTYVKVCIILLHLDTHIIVFLNPKALKHLKTQQTLKYALFILELKI